MGYFCCPVSDYPGVTHYEKKIVEVRIAGQCEMCETEFDVKATSTNDEWDLLEYECPCGYFLLFGDYVIEDDHGITKEGWMRRLQKKKAAAS